MSPTAPRFPLAKTGRPPYKTDMCKPFREYLSLLRDYTREIVTFGGFCLMCFVYSDFRRLACEQSTTAAHTVDVLRSMDARLAHIEHAAPALKAYEK
jgi:hypothetical protein